MCANGVGHGQHVLEVCRTVLIRWRANGNQLEQAVGHALFPSVVNRGAFSTLR